MELPSACTLGSCTSQHLHGRCARRMFAMLLLAVIACFCACSSGDRELPIHGSVSSFQGVWEYRYGACPLDSAQKPLCLQKNWNDGSFVAGPTESPPGRGGHNELWLRTTLPLSGYTDPVIFFRFVDQHYEAYLDGILVDKSPGNLLSHARFSGVYRLYLPLGRDYAGKRLVMRIQSRYWHIGVHRDQLIGEHSAIIGMTIRGGLSTVMVGSMLMVLALIGLALAAIEHRRDFAYYGTFALTSGAYLLARSPLRIFLFGDQELARVVELSTLALMAASLCAFVDALFGSGPLQLLRHLARFFVVFYLSSLLLTALDVFPFEWFLLPLQIFLLVMFFVLFVNAIRINMMGTLEARIMSVGMAISVMPTLYDLLATINVFQRYVVLTQYSVALFVLSVGVIVARRFIKAREAQLQLQTEAAQAQIRLGEQAALLQAAKRIAEGDLDAPIEVPQDNPLKSLADALNHLRSDVRSKIKQLSSRNAATKQLNDELRRQIEQRSRRLLDLILQRPLSAQGETHLKVQSMLGEHYKIICLLGTGATGVVVEVERTTDGKHLAAKVLTKATDKTGVIRFLREAQILSRLDHPNLVSIKDVDVTDNGVPFLVMELVEGQTLRQHRSRYKELRFALSVLRQIAEALAEIHACGVVHRDLRPSNILVTADSDTPKIKLFDFGVAALRVKEGAESGTYPKQKVSSSGTISSDRLDVSSHGIVIGSPMYIAPESRQGSSAVGPPADVFSLGVIAWELLTGELPFSRPPVDISASPDSMEAPKLHTKLPNVNPALEILVASCLQLDPAKRLTASQVAEELRLQEDELVQTT